MIIAMINYLWPPLMIVFSILAKQLRAQFGVVIGFILAVFGLMLVVNPDILNIHQFWQVLQQNPWAFTFALMGAVLWPLYSIFTKKYANGQNGVPLFFVVSVLSLWILHLGFQEIFVMPSISDWVSIAVIGSLVGIAYSNWNQSMQFGNMKILILATYFMPVLSSLMSMIILDVDLQMNFWIGSALVSIGAIICWKSTTEQLEKTSLI